jgi:hypothetical protein
VAIGLLYYFGNVYQRAYYTALGVIPEDLQFSVQAMLAESPDAIFLPLWFLLVCGLIVLLVLGWAGQSLSGPRHAARRSKVIFWLLGSGLVLLLLGFPVFLWEENLPTLPGGWAAQFVPAMLVALGATLAFFAVQLRLTHDGRTHDRPARTGDRLWLSGGALLLGLLTMTLFFTMARYASMAGVSNAVATAQDHYRKSQHVLVHSRVILQHHAQGIRYQDLGDRAGPYRYVVPWEVTAVRVTLNRPGSSAVCESATWPFSPGCSSMFSQPFSVIEVSPVSVAAAKCCNVVGTWPVLTKSTLPPAGSPTFAVGTWISGAVRPSSEPSPTSTLPSAGPLADAVLRTDPVAVVPVGWLPGTPATPAPVLAPRCRGQRGNHRCHGKASGDHRRHGVGPPLPSVQLAGPQRGTPVRKR